MDREGTQVGQCQRVYLATVFHNGRPYAEAVPDYPYILESYHYLGSSAGKRDLLREFNRSIFLDSGAFSAFTLGATIDIRKYAKFILANSDIIDVASVLDGIGDAQLTLDNQHQLEDLGVQVLPCFHFGEDVSYLERYLEDYDHITIGGMVPIPNAQLLPWLDFLWANFLTDDKGWPLAKVHGFGLTAMNLVYRYPWYSVDSSSWVQSGAFGQVATITDKGTIRAIPMSEDSPAVHTMNQHYDNMPPYAQEFIRQTVATYGSDIEELRTNSTARKQHNAKVYADLGTRNVFQYQTPSQGLFE